MSEKRCSVEGCTKPYRNRGYCRPHLIEAYPDLAPGPCAVGGCVKTVQARGLCAMHYARALRAERGIAAPEKNRVGVDPLTKIIARCEIGLCWSWQRGQSSSGYGVVAYGGRNHYTHRAMWELLIGPIPAGMEIDHLCKNKLCCNPEHLEPVTPRVNKLRSGSPSGRHARREVCDQGHPFSEENTVIRHGYRTCRTCTRDKSRAYKASRRAAARRADEAAR